MRRATTVAIGLLLYAVAIPVHAATITVTNGNDSGAGSLRQAIIAASPGDTINFAPSVTTVTLTSGELVIDKNLTITGPGANRLTVQRSPPNGPQFRIFRISSSAVTVSISGITISHGFLEDGPGGGGIFSAGVLTLTDCTISDNNSGDPNFGSILGGGGVMNDHGTMTITGCTIGNNSARGRYDLNAICDGGVILNDSGSLIITNSTISGNSCSAFSPEPLFAGVASGGGISNRGDLQITSSTIADNSASGNQAYGGGIYGFGSTTTDSSIIALNSAAVGPDFTGPGELQSTGYNIIGNSAGGVINSQPTDQIGINPRLGPLGDNGGPTLTHALQPGSPAINRGDPAAPPRDQRRYSRVGVPDVGAFEFGGSAPRGDFNGDGFIDYLLFNSESRATAVWYLNNNTYIGSGYAPSLRAGWTIVDVADFNRDAHPDYALFNPSTRQTAIWYLNNRLYLGGAYGPTLPNGWRLAAASDFNRDGKPDYVLYNASTRQTAIWYLNNNVYVRAAYGPTIASGYALSGVADFNGDGKPDYLLYNATTRRTAIWYLNNNVYVSGADGPTIASGYVLSGVADFNVDGHPDYLLYNSTTHRTEIWYLNNNVYVRAAYGPTLPTGWSLVAP
jgi:hypothetical protein